MVSHNLKCARKVARFCIDRYENDFRYQKLNYTAQKVRAQIQFCFLPFLFFFPCLLSSWITYNKIERLMKRRHFKIIIRNCFAHFDQIKWEIQFIRQHCCFVLVGKNAKGESIFCFGHFNTKEIDRLSTQVKNDEKFSLTRNEYIEWRALNARDRWWWHELVTIFLFLQLQSFPHSLFIYRDWKSSSCVDCQSFSPESLGLFKSLRVIHHNNNSFCNSTERSLSIEI